MVQFAIPSYWLYHMKKTSQLGIIPCLCFKPAIMFIMYIYIHYINKSYTYMNHIYIYV